VAGVYEWDEEKAAENLEKHGVAFSEAIQVFDDHSSVEEYDIDHSTPDESRFWRIGFSGSRLLYVVFTVREEKVRIIHARKASRLMEQIYAENKIE